MTQTKKRWQEEKINLDHLAFNGYMTKVAIHLGYMNEFEFSLTGQH